MTERTFHRPLTGFVAKKALRDVRVCRGQIHKTPVVYTGEGSCIFIYVSLGVIRYEYDFVFMILARGLFKLRTILDLPVALAWFL